MMMLKNKKIGLPTQFDA